MSAQPAEAAVLPMRPRGWQTTEFDAERQLVGSLLINVDAVADLVNVDDVNDARLQKIAAVALAMATRGEYPLPLAVAKEINDPRISLSFITDDVMEVAHVLGGVAAAAGSAALVRENAERRRVVDVARRVQIEAAEGGNTDALRELLVSADADASARAVFDALAPISDGTLSRMPPPRRWLLRHPTRNGVPVDDRHGDGLLPLGKVGVLLAAGGVGKTRALIQLAVAVITGRPWFGHFDIDRGASGDVLLALAEEDQEEVDRRLFDVANSMSLTEDERREVERRLVVLPLVGRQCAVATMSNGGEIKSTRIVDDLLRRMKGRTWSLAVFDPLSRWAGLPIDVDNTNATFVVTQLERVAIATGATVLVAHHTNSASRKEGRADSRGATAITDGARWVASLTEDGDAVKFRQTKSNYSRPMPEGEALRLIRSPGGALGVAAPDVGDVRSHEDKQGELMLAIVSRLREAGGAPSSNDVHRVIKGNRSDFLDAWNKAKRQLGWIVNDGTARDPHYVASPTAPPGKPRSVCVARPPHPLAGNREPAEAGPVPSSKIPVPGTAQNRTEPDGTGKGEE